MPMPAVVVETWTGRESALLRSALRLSMRAFAEHLGVATRTVAKWEAKGAGIRPLPDMQAILDTALNRASAQVRERFAGALTASLEADARQPFSLGPSRGPESRDRRAGAPEEPVGLDERVGWAASALDAELVELFEQQTQSYRLLDRRLGAGRLLAQTEAHVQQMAEVLTYAPAGPDRGALAAALAEGAALAGWQALDLGLPDRAWLLHETAKAAAAQSGGPAVLAHVSAQQAYALIDVDRADDALTQIRLARETAGTGIPVIVHAWLWAAEAEAASAAGREPEARTALDHAVQLLGTGTVSGPGREIEQVPYLTLDPVHLARWRGHCLARLGADEAVGELSLALETMPPAFVRAAAGLHCDLAIAHAARHETEAALAHAERAAVLADVTTSVRQQRRIQQVATG